MAALAEVLAWAAYTAFEVVVAVAAVAAAAAAAAMAAAAAVLLPHPPRALASLRSAYQITKPRLMDAAANSA